MRLAVALVGTALLLSGGLASAFPAPDGRELAVFDESPVWSPDGSRIAFYRVTLEGQVERSSLYVVRSDGTHLRLLAETGPWSSTTFRRTASWSPDSRTIAFTVTTGSYDAPRSHAYVIDLDGSDLRRLLRNDAWSYTPTWAPRGKTIAVAAEIPKRGRGLFVVDGRGTSIRLLAAAEADSAPPLDGRPSWLAWSPDGSAIAYSSSNRRVYLVAAGGGEARFITAGCCPIWTHDGSRIAFRRGCAIEIVHQDGVGPPADERCFQIGYTGASFSPHDDELLACLFHPRGCSLLVFHVTDTSATQPLYLGIDGHDPSWSPDGRRIVFAREHLYVLTLTADRVTKLRRLT